MLDIMRILNIHRVIHYKPVCYASHYYSLNPSCILKKACLVFLIAKFINIHIFVKKITNISYLIYLYLLNKCGSFNSHGSVQLMPVHIDFFWIQGFNNTSKTINELRHSHYILGENYRCSNFQMQNL